MKAHSDISKYSESEQDIVNHLINGRNSTNISLAINYFKQALTKSKKILRTSKIGKSLYLESMVELANNEPDIKNRTSLWEELFEKIIIFLNDNNNTQDNLVHFTDLLTSYTQEAYIHKDYHTVKKGMIILKSKIDASIKYFGIENSTEVLIKKATILRNFSLYQPTIVSKKTMLNQALRCAEKAISNSKKNWYSYLELGRIYWLSSNYEKNIKLFNEKIILAEKNFKLSQNLKCTIENTLSLCQLYKQTFQTSPFLTEFNTYEGVEKNKRRFLRHSFLLAEVTIRMYYADYPDNILTDYLKKSEDVLNNAISAGFNNARIITNLAFIKAIQGEVTVGKHIMKTLRTTSADSFDWNLIIEDMKSISNSNDLFSNGFVLGIDDSRIWNKLGTFAINFLKDLNLGLKMYDVALNLNPKNPIVLTNISRTLLKTNLDQSKLEKAEYLISKAASASTFRFQWWRKVKEDVELAKNSFAQTKIQKSNKQNFNLSKISDIYKYFLKLKEMNNPQQRGFDFEKLISAYFQLSLGNAINSHRIKSKTIEQIDAAFFFDKSYYRVEAKWTKDKTDHTDISEFYFKLKTVGVRGLIISISGFTNAAVERARELKNEVFLILMDGDEIESTMKGSPSFDEAIRLKQLYFYYEDNPYYKINGNGNQNTL